jgi:Periplasmic protein involved in polysaccharide export
MEKMGKCFGGKRVFFLYKIVILTFCMIFCPNAQNKGPHNRVISSLADLNDTLMVSSSNVKTDNMKNAEKYPFHCGDAVGISVVPDTAAFLSGQFPIDDDGCIDLPIVGRKPVTSMTQEELGNYIKNTFMQYLHFPSVRVQPLIRLELMGGFQRPGFYYFSPHTSFWEVFRIAGVPIREDGIEKLKLKRARTAIDFDPVLSVENTQSLRQMGLRSGDQIMVTARPLKTSWDYFKDDVLPILSLTLTVAATTATAYITYQTFNRGGR